MRKMMKKAIALGLIATMSMSAATIVHAEDKVTLRVLNRRQCSICSSSSCYSASSYCISDWTEMDCQEYDPCRSERIINNINKYNKYNRRLMI